MDRPTCRPTPFHQGRLYSAYTGRCFHPQGLIRDIILRDNIATVSPKRKPNIWTSFKHSNLSF